MKVFIDATILVPVLNKKLPFYFASKKNGAKIEKQKIGILAEKIRVAENKQEDV